MLFRFAIVFALMTAASIVMADNKYKMRTEKRSLPLCPTCPRIALPSDETCDEWAPEFGAVEGQDGCECLKKYVCCPKKCPTPPENACPRDTTGDFYTENGTDCCDCDTTQCKICPRVVPEEDRHCHKCFHYEEHFIHQEDTKCWESGCKHNESIIYPPANCDSRCQRNVTKDDGCGNDEKICEDKSIPVDCQPPKPDQKQCFHPPTKEFINRFYPDCEGEKLETGKCEGEVVCKKCWKWVETRKPDSCQQVYPESEHCSADHSLRRTGQTPCGTTRNICLECKVHKPKCTECQILVQVRDGCSKFIDTCVQKTCPSLSHLKGKTCTTINVQTDSCGCETITCSTWLSSIGLKKKNTSNP